MTIKELFMEALNGRRYLEIDKNNNHPYFRFCNTEVLQNGKEVIFFSSWTDEEIQSLKYVYRKMAYLKEGKIFIKDLTKYQNFWEDTYSRPKGKTKIEKEIIEYALIFDED